jgi:hypothetical protein
VSLALVATMFASVSSAQATTGVCVFTGLSGALTPPIESIQKDLTQAGDPLLDVERGGYNFSTGTPADAVCAGTFNGVPQVVTNASITSEGSYDNIKCGTGFAHDLDGDGTLVTGGTPPVTIGGSADPAGYEIPFVGGTGPLLIGPNGKAPLAAATDLLPADPDNVPANHTDAHNPVVSNYVGLGAVNIVPVSPGNCVNQDVGVFTVTGFFVATNGSL